ncbi:hypothetical protein AMTR_s00014p00229180 [Amborella trichopoda]|uniref:Uncharacterized protein n=1 Tax=Amborella trichopoda TaxID=13333 RepID=W1PN18_AMBTC|nr:hypothetical protein AMTR_s00014p00229180 [Amborella trichopoda]
MTEVEDGGVASDHEEEAVTTDTKTRKTFGEVRRERKCWRLDRRRVFSLVENLSLFFFLTNLSSGRVRNGFESKRDWGIGCWS